MREVWLELGKPTASLVEQEIQNAQKERLEVASTPALKLKQEALTGYIWKLLNLGLWLENQAVQQEADSLLSPVKRRMRAVLKQLRRAEQVVISKRAGSVTVHYQMVDSEGNPIGTWGNSNELALRREVNVNMDLASAIASREKGKLREVYKACREYARSQARLARIQDTVTEIGKHLLDGYTMALTGNQTEGALGTVKAWGPSHITRTMIRARFQLIKADKFTSISNSGELLVDGKPVSSFESITKAK